MKSDNHDFGTIRVSESDVAKLKTLIRQAKDLWHYGNPGDLGKKLDHIDSLISGLNDVTRTRMD